MKRIFVTLAALALLTAGSSQAQNWFGLRSGFPLGVTVHYGIANALSNGFDLRISGKVVARGSITSVGLGLDAMSEVVNRSPFSVYIGAGPAFEFGSGSFLLDVHGLVGGEFRFTDLGLPALGIFVEGTLGANLELTSGSARIPTFGAALGFNFRL